MSGPISYRETRISSPPKENSTNEETDGRLAGPVVAERCCHRVVRAERPQEGRKEEEGQKEQEKGRQEGRDEVRFRDIFAGWPRSLQFPTWATRRSGCILPP